MLDLVRSIQMRDPASPTFFEVILGYNGFHAVLLHRMNSAIWGLGLRAVARCFANISRILTGIEIHPEAQIGKRLFIDHGNGVVIGQTSVVGDDVTIYHGVTLGGVGRIGQVDDKRHPTVQSHAMVGAGAQVLGDVTVGEHAKIGANSVVTNDVPAHRTALGIPARVVGGDDRDRAYGLPSRKEMAELNSTIDCLMEEVGHLRSKLGVEGPDCAEKKAKKPAAKKTPTKKAAPKKTAAKKTVAKKAPERKKSA